MTTAPPAHYSLGTIDTETEPPDGPACFIGAPEAGKTALARKLAGRKSAATGYPILALDPARTSYLADIPHAASVREVLEAAWGRHEHVAFTPREDDAEPEAVKIMKAARASGGVVVFLDELKVLFPSIRSMPLAVQAAARMWRWNDIPAIYVTSQSYSDCARALRSVVSRWYIFRMLAGADVDDLESDFRLPPDLLPTLPQAHFVKVKTGFR